MLALALLLLQAAVAGPPVAAPPRRQEAAPCPAGEDGDVVVCAPDQQQFRLGPPPRARADGGALPAARVGLGGKASLSAETEQAGVGGFPSNRAMIRLRLGL